MWSTILTIALVLPLLTGCGSDRSKAEESQRQFRETVQATNSELQWRLDDETAVHIFSESQYLTFRKCHDTPPARDSHKKQCAFLQNAVAQEEARAKEKQDKERASW